MAYENGKRQVKLCSWTSIINITGGHSMGVQRTSDERLTFHGLPTGYQLGDFWSWSSSELLNNTLRGSLCEFIVASALGVDLSGSYEDWLPFDIAFPHKWQRDGQPSETVRIEVKSSAYLQAWPQSKPSHITFGIRPTKAWDPVDGFAGETVRQSDVYVFGVYTEKDRSRADPLILDGWDFYMLPTKTLDAVCGQQKSISLPSLLSLDPVRADYAGIKAAVLSCACSLEEAEHTL